MTGEMTAWVAKTIGEPLDVMETRKLPIPTPGEGQVRVAVMATGLNFPDLLQLRGEYQVRPAFPLVVGTEVAGIVEQVGPGVDQGLEGSRIAASVSGALAPFALCDVDRLHRLSDTIPFEKAVALLSNYTTAYYALHDRGHLRDGETLLVTAAAGGVGSSAVQLGRAAGARVIAAVGSTEKVAHCEAMGVDSVVTYPDDDLVGRVRGLTGDNGVDVIYDPVSGDLFDQLRRTVAFGGRYLVIGFAGGRIPNAPLNHVLLKNYGIVGVHWGAAIDRDPRRMTEIYTELVALYDEGRIDPLLHSNGAAPFDEAASLLTQLGKRRTVGKVVLAPSS